MTDTEGPLSTTISDAEMMKFFTTRTDLVHIVGMPSRPGFLIAMAATEYIVFDPLEEKNLELFHVHQIVWQDILWVAFSFPKKHLPEFQYVLKMLGMKMADGVPTMLNFVGNKPVPDFFPGSMLPNGQDNRNMFSLKNNPDSVVYKNRRGTNEAILERSDEAIDRMAQGWRPSLRNLSRYVWGDHAPET